MRARGMEIEKKGKRMREMGTGKRKRRRRLGFVCARARARNAMPRAVENGEHRRIRQRVPITYRNHGKLPGRESELGLA